MSISDQFQKVFKKGRCALMAEIVIGYPDLDTSKQLVWEVAQAGVDFIELQIPFSEPIANNPIFFEANQTALRDQVPACAGTTNIQNGTNVPACFKLMEEISSKVDIPFLFMSYYNLLFRYGIDKFCREAKKAGCQGLIIPDLPPEEAKDYLIACNKYNLASIFIVATTSPIDRIKKICKATQGFLYCVNQIELTAEKTKLESEFSKFITKIKTFCKTPLGISFGVKNKKDLAIISKYADLAIIGAPIIQTWQEQGIEGVKNLIKTLKM